MRSTPDGRGSDDTGSWVPVDPDVAITIVFCFLVALVALGGGYLVRYETRRDRSTIGR
jgi:hypothetical protein